ncbi:MAG: Sec-independent protein translocase protein TatB [Alphaproteobacteria bacterium]
MFDFSWTEILLIAVVALMVVRPKDLPQVLKVVAQFARKARGMAREFQSGLEEMVREAELHEVKKEIESVAATDFSHELEQSIDPGGTVAKSLDLQAEAAASVTPAAAEPEPALAPPADAPPPEALPAPAEEAASEEKAASEDGAGEPAPALPQAVAAGQPAPLVER